MSNGKDVAKKLLAGATDLVRRKGTHVLDVLEGINGNQQLMASDVRGLREEQEKTNELLGELNNGLNIIFEFMDFAAGEKCEDIRDVLRAWRDYAEEDEEEDEDEEEEKVIRVDAERVD